VKDGAWSMLTDTSAALDHPVTRLTLAVAAGGLLLVPLVALALQATGRLGEATRRDVWTRYFTWLWFAPAVLIPVLATRLTAVAALTLAALLCYREFARATGLFRERLLSALVALAILVQAFASLDNWYRLFVAVAPMTMVSLAAAAVLADRPKGYLQRVSLGVVGLLLFGSGLMHMALLTVDPAFRPMLCVILLCTQLSDIAAYCSGKALGRRKVFVNTSPSKTLGGHVGALLITAPLAAWLLHASIPRADALSWWVLAALGLTIAVGAQFGDLVLGSIKRDLGVKDLAQTLPGHGGFTDRFNSMLLVAPTMFHAVNYLVGVGAGQPVRVLSGA
jgi:phosphatidate cytidylyltransferase